MFTKSATRMTATLLITLALIASSAVFISPVSAGSDVWTSHGPEGGYITVLVFDPANANILYAGTTGGGLFKSTNSGDTWQSCGLAGKTVHALVIDPHDPAILYAGIGFDGMYKSSNGGNTWTKIGLSSASVYALVIDPENANTLYAGTFPGMPHWRTPAPS